MTTIETTFWIITRNEESDVKPGTVIGKYLFFSDDKNLLQITGEDILREHKLSHMKISADKNHNADSGFGYVLCVYSNNSELRDELKSKETSILNYRFFKSDNATRAGIYSKQYKKTL
jgi:hypothetical protein